PQTISAPVPPPPPPDGPPSSCAAPDGPPSSGAPRPTPASEPAGDAPMGIGVEPQAVAINVRKARALMVSSERNQGVSPISGKLCKPAQHVRYLPAAPRCQLVEGRVAPAGRERHVVLALVGKGVPVTG